MNAVQQLGVSLYPYFTPCTLCHPRGVSQCLRPPEEPVNSLTVNAARVCQMGLSHDLGKAGAPNIVLCKTDQCTNEEFAFIETTSSMCVRLSACFSLAALAHDSIIYQHQAHPDGSGHRQVLNDDGIPQQQCPNCDFTRGVCLVKKPCELMYCRNCTGVFQLNRSEVCPVPGLTVCMGSALCMELQPEATRITRTVDAAVKAMPVANLLLISLEGDA